MECKLDLNNKIDFINLKPNIKNYKNLIIEKVKSLICLAPYHIERSTHIISSKANELLLLHELAEFVPGLKEVGYDKKKY